MTDAGFGMVGPVDVERAYLDDIEKLREAALYAQGVLSRVRAFGDDIGPDVSKAELATAHNKLSLVLASVRA